MSDAALPLIRTKLHAPRRRRGVVERPRLRDRVDRDDQPALTLVSAPAGFGKTTAAAEWFADDPRAAWLSLDRRDDDPSVFWRYVVAALDTADPRAAAGAGALLGSGPVAAEAVVATLLNEVAALDDGVVLVLDDYHVIGSSAIHESVGLLVEHLPPQLRLVLVTRADPPLPLAALRARGELFEVRAADLRFTADEAADYLEHAMDIELRPEEIDVLGARTEGWIAALQLAALSMQGRDDVGAFIADFSGDDRFILDYLVGEVLQQQGDDVTRFLLETSVLQRLTGGLCDAVTGRDDGRAMLERLERANLFLVPLDDRREWYRYHHLFADALRARLLDERGGAVADLHRRASEWWGDQGDPAEAVGHAMAAGDPERAARWIELAAPAMRLARQESTLRGWLDALPVELFTDRPVLALALVGARMATGDPAGTEPLLALAEASVGRAGGEPIAVDPEELATAPAQISVYRAGLAVLAGDVDAAVEHATHVLAVAAPTDHYRRGAASALIGLAEWRTGAIDAARDRYVVAVESFRASGHLPDLLGCSVGLADLQLAQGRLGDAGATYTAGLRLTAEHARLRGAADMHVGLAEVLLERADLDAAAAQLDAAVALGDGAGLPQHAYRRRVVAALLHQARGELDAAAALLDEAEPVYDTDFSPDVRPIPARRARLQLAAGDLDAAARWAASRGLAADDDLSYVSEYEHVTLARLLVERGSATRDPQVLAEAEGLLDRLLVAADAGGRTGTAIEVLVLLARACAARGRSAEAGELLADALGRAVPEAHLRPFVDGGAGLGSMLRALDGSDAAGRLATAALAARGGTAASRPATGSVDGLSERELDVLRLLRGDLSGPEIARELHVSLNTFRTHTKNIYAKLGVNNRREAVRRATELRI